ncbi:MAG: aminopeptidase [Chloroflexia bacterium]|nr:aminopeptidase [Chloroflexia bacterium]
MFFYCIFITLGISNCRLISYGIKQGIGQIRIVKNARPIDEIMQDTSFSEDLKQKLLLVEEIKQFAIDSLGLNPSKNYNTLYDQKGEPILWVVGACPPYKLEAYKWKFPIVGSLPYKGYFKKEDAIKEAKKLEEGGFDSRVGTASAWSTLGFFKDPILSEMLNQSEGQIARLVIHELTHSTLYVKGDAQFNENLATFVGDEGAKYFLKYKYGENSQQYSDYLGELNDVEKFSSHILNGAKQLDSLYLTFSSTMTENDKKEAKYDLIQTIVNKLDTITFHIPQKFSKLQNPQSLPNNAFFVGYITYHKDQGKIWDDFRLKFKSDFRKYLEYLKNNYESV